MKLIDAHELIKRISNFDLPDDTIDALTLRIIIAEMSAINITRCKHCKYGKKCCAPGGGTSIMCKFSDFLRDPNGYCDEGEPKDGEFDDKTD